MPNAARPSLDAAAVFTALATLADRSGPPGAAPGAPPDAGEERWALASALALRHTRLPQARSEGEGARVLPFPSSVPSAAAVPVAVPARAARKAPVVSLERVRKAAGRPAEADGSGGPESPGHGMGIRLVPAPGSVPGLDEGASRLTVFRSLDGGQVLGREVAAGARVVISRREPAVGDVALYATRRALGLCPAGTPPAGARILGVVEAVFA